MKFLSLNIKTIDDLKKAYREYAKKLHPDCGGSTEDMQLLNDEFSMLFGIIKNRTYTTNTTRGTTGETTETAAGIISEFYTANGWSGSRYDGKLTIKEIAAKVRNYCKVVYPTCKFSVTCGGNYLYSTLHIALIEAPFDAFIDNTLTYKQLNHNFIKEDERLTEKTRIMFTDIIDYAQSYNYNDSDGMIDYFDFNFCLSVDIGKWDKPFKVVEKTERLTSTDTATTTPATEKTAEAPYTYDIKEDTDTRDGSRLFVVKILEKLTPEAYKKAANYMKSKGGYYSRFKHGFIFREYPDLIPG